MTLANSTRTAALAVSACLLLAALILTPAAKAGRTLLSEAALRTTFCLHCPPPSGSPVTLKPPSEGQIEGACGLAIKPGGETYVADYYHRVIDAYGPFGGQPAEYQFQIALPGSNPTFGTNTLDAVCGLAFDGAGNLYGNELHQRVIQLTPSEVTIDTGESTGLAIDPATDRLYVDDRTYISSYDLPFDSEAEPLPKIAVDPTADYFGLAAFGGRLYVADDSDQMVKAFEPASDESAPVATISAGFGSLTDAALAVDPTNGHLLVVENVQPLFEHPRSAIHEFAAPAQGYADLGTLPGAPIFGGPSGIAVSPGGTVLVTDGNDELANAFAYGPHSTGFAPQSPIPAAATSAVAASAAAQAAPSSLPLVSGQAKPRPKHHRRHVARRRRAHRSVGGKR